MLLRKEHIDGGGLIGIRKITDNHQLLLEALPQNQQKAAGEYISDIRSERRIIEWLTTRVLLFELLGEEKIIDNRLDGRPFLIDNSYKISISHTRDYVAILLHKHYTVGIDVETISERVIKLADKFISEEEYIDSSQKVIHQLLHWSAKETMFKMMEESEIDFKEHLHVQAFTPQEKGVFQAYESKTNEQKTFQIHYEILPNAVLTWAVDNEKNLSQLFF
ncbi:MAG: 4'-phosphopantetheinyl transferase superfamily protein [Bacteroidia bacterium]|nr:4'-phosphopantetheinyl transferase superfamily protein [Bacteroidia bacterium]